MISVLLIEDELPARKKLIRYLKELDEDIQILGEIDTVIAGIDFLKSGVPIDLIISDIELRDGIAFSIFEQVSLNSPIIFTTAYNKFWMEAFESNGIAYLLKPFNQEKFNAAWEKYLRISKIKDSKEDFLGQLKTLLGYRENLPKTTKSKLNIPTARGSYFLDMDEVVYFNAEQGVVFAFDRFGKKHILKEATLKEVEIHLETQNFFRINRSQVIQKQYVLGTERYSKNAVAVRMKGFQELLVCSQRQTPSFLSWMEG